MVGEEATEIGILGFNLVVLKPAKPDSLMIEL